MAKITDYRTESQKRLDAQREKIQKRYNELLAEGLTPYRASVITAKELGWSPSGVRKNAQRYENQSKSEQL